ncbi:unannotated protein [freshwater metagenome]|uniref:DNA 3'-5' helicase n=1 Tax=freshwater metagenome TaxID=449393 RepID=A0A6J7KXP5_9ZZZZ|nr:DEAD/DEAH box helicase [Actinomycetota bacterium]
MTLAQPANVRPSEAALREAALTVIEALAGPGATVRDDQFEAARALVVEGRRALVVQATGWGKSAVYWIAARAVRDSGSGPVLVVSPLLSLMRDQVAAASRAGLVAVTLNSSNVDDWSAFEKALLDDTIDVVLVSPERLANPRFATAVLDPLLPRLGLLVIDEAHCISSWGHDFRPDYQRIARLLLANPSLPVLATTATANARVTADVAAQLGPDTFVQRGQLARTSLHLSVVPGLNPIERYAWVDDALRVLSGSGIVYVLTVAEATRLNAFLLSRGHVTAEYTGQLEADDRVRVEAALRANEVKAVVATSALGMGYDKPDLAFCLHVGSPPSPVDYYQQVGRAGRALDSAVVALLPSSGDERLWEWFATSNVPNPLEAQAVLDELERVARPVTVPALESATGVRRSRIELLVKVLAVEGAVERSVEGWASTGQHWEYDAPRYAELVAARRSEAALMRSYATSRACLETLLRRSLDDEVAIDARCGRCSVCVGALPAGLELTPQAETVEAASVFLRSQDVQIEPRKLWAAGLVGFSGRISGAMAVEQGRALAFADDPAWAKITELLADSAPDQQVPEWVVEASVAVLARWARTWGRRPGVVVPVPSSTRPQLVASLASRLAEVGQLALVDALDIVGARSGGDPSAAARAREVESRIALRPGTAQSLAGAVVLLVDDTLRTGWTLTLSGALLRRAGAAAVHPFVLHQRP